MNSQEVTLRRRDAEVKAGQESLAHALTKTLVLLPHKGNCKCGMMLTEQDRSTKTETYLCPRCGKSGHLVPVLAVPQKKGCQEKS